ncbi:response regulator [Amnibacterium endophyticum]|uniref:Response regulator n=1 Tax=Amnibacterium endophyticum TaxID=2109337 RepID=A0ABW4LHA3_9MICO
MTAPSRAVLLADADPLHREGWRLVIDAQPDLAVVGEVPDGIQLLAHLRRHAVDVVVADVRMPRLGGVQALRRAEEDATIRLTQRETRLRTVLVTATDLDRHGPAALAAGAHAVLWKGAHPEELLAAIRG